MRSERAFLSEYREALGRVDPSCLDGLAGDRVRTLGQTEICLAFLERFLPDESYRTVPFLMMGYGKLLDGRAREPERVGRALAAIRHLSSRFGSVSAWIDATAQYARTPGTVRCFDLDAKGVTARAAAPALLRAVLDRWLASTVGWTERELRLADPGEAFVTVSPRTKLSYRIPAVPPERRAANRYALRPRATNPRIRVTFDELRAVARQVDAREREAGWPADSLPPLDLERRLDKLEPRDVSGFLDGDAIVLDGATHVVGMLSSGKSTLVMALLLGLTLGGSGKRIAVLVTDTMQGATLAARLRRHGVRATVLSSLRNREGHLHAIHWQRSLSATGWSLSGLGDLSEGFGTACPLDGSQGDPEVVEGERGADWTFPRFAEKQCHRIYQKALSDEDDGSGHPGDPDDVVDMPRARSCPLWATCPAQEQQRSAVDAQVLFMTPQAFVHITPDKWTTERHVSMPELVQYEFDLVIVDEVDGVQKGLDDAFAPRSPIMGDDRDVYAPNIGLRSSEALRERSGAQFRKPLNAKWQSNFYTFFRLIGMIYAVLQNERSDLRTFYEDTPFTAGSILYDLWRRKNLASGLRREDQTFSNPVFAAEFLEVVKVASAIRGFSPVSSVSTDEPEGEGEGIAGPAFADARFEAAAAALRELAREIVVADTYEGLTERVTAALGREGPLAVFNGARLGGRKSEFLSLRGAALAVILATVTDLALSHYNWLIKTQSAVARDFKIEDGYLLGRTDSLIRNYKTLLPANPAGAAFGLFYDEPGDRERQAMGGKLTLLSHLGVGRHLLTHLHDLLAAEGQAGPHVLMLSGTSWAGGGERRPNPATGKPMDAASPSFDVQVPVKGVLVQPQAELEAVKRSVFALVNVRVRDGRQLRVSGMPQAERRANLATIAERLATPRDGLNRFEDDWRRMSERWGEDPTGLGSRRRAMLVTNSYDDAAVVADALATALDRSGYSDWKVHCLVRDRSDEDEGGMDGVRVAQARPMPRSLVERFGLEPERSILVAPMQIVARGHNILNGAGKAGISAIHFLHRPHPRPDDLGPTIGRLNRFAQERFDKGVRPPQDADGKDSVESRARRVRHAANGIVRYGLEAGRFGYQSLPAEFKAQFAWDLLTPLWQTVGRGIRGGCPVFIGFVDDAFAPLSFAGEQPDTPESSALVQCLRQLRDAIDPAANPKGHEVARLLYQPFHDALAATEGLRLA